MQKLLLVLLPVLCLAASSFSVLSGAFNLDQQNRISSSDAFSFLSARMSRSERLDFGPIHVSMMNDSPRTTVTVLADVPSGSLNSQSFSSYSLDETVCEFPENFARQIKNSHVRMLTPQTISADSLADIAVVLGASHDASTATLTFDGVTFAYSALEDRAFLADLALVLGMPARLSAEARHAHTHQYVLALAASQSLPVTKLPAAQRLLEGALALLAAQKINLHVIATPMAAECPSLTPQNHDESMLMSPSNALLTAAAQVPAIPTTRSPAVGNDAPAAETINASLWNINFWTGLLLILILIAATVFLWNMSVFEDPLVFQTGFVFTEEEEPDL
ncbi:hypothetical protein PAPYR_1637 [Paratrimastix pyriformis]|uniref:Uncharacterized protein n=1 Tax=Paratrimastix pyriformis TaxID=342808 RepID=A0ABQ8US25_9EUKA|nr:hypothetical protein PAPYR_1637 [Paratrimastix pyriformis]|eukprot:GAFH01002106.1.p1 GENE.GAFH01002106.1~~GAFH01002106.1.p1  ORF type:complete len:334 (-),score=137.90 GAFH01002106.1:266-1267(-)